MGGRTGVVRGSPNPPVPMPESHLFLANFGGNRVRFRRAGVGGCGMRAGRMRTLSSVTACLLLRHGTYVPRFVILNQHIRDDGFFFTFFFFFDKGHTLLLKKAKYNSYIQKESKLGIPVSTKKLIRNNRKTNNKLQKTTYYKEQLTIHNAKSFHPAFKRR